MTSGDAQGRRVLLDEMLPRLLARELPGHNVTTVAQEGWTGVLNGELLRRAEAAGVAVFITADRKMEAAGLTAGVLFFAHAMVPYSRAWPLLWPLLGGVAAAVLASRERRLSGGQRARVGASAGAVAGVVFLLATGLALYVISLPGMESVAGLFGAVEPIAFNPALLAALAIAAVIGIAAGALGGAAGGALHRRRAV